jgi:hypothetical protein
VPFLRKRQAGLIDGAADVAYLDTLAARYRAS